jgi:Ca2+-binding RTX toxin-like protein
MVRGCEPRIDRAAGGGIDVVHGGSGHDVLHGGSGANELIP